MAAATRGSGALIATLAAAVMIAGQVGSKAARDALFLDVFEAAQLPKAMLVSALLSAIGVLLMSQGLGKVGPARLVPAMFALSGVCFVAEWAFADRLPRLVAALVYMHVAVLGSLLVSGFWSVVSERFDPHSAKKVVARITVGATSGGLIGGVVAERVAVYADTRTMLLVLAAMSIACAALVFQTARGSARLEAQSNVLDGLRHFKEAPYLKLLGLLVVLTAIASGVIDYAFKAEADAALTSREELMSFFAIFYTVTGLITFVAQAGLSAGALERLGIGGTIAMLPAMVALSSVLGAAVTHLWSVVAARATENVLSNSLYQSGYQLLFTPLAPSKKRPTKTVIDVGFDKLGTAVGSAIVILLLWLVPNWATSASLALGALVSMVSLYVALRLHRGYVNELAASLKSGRLKLADDEVIDGTTRRTLADTTMAIDRESLLAEIEALRLQSTASDDDASIEEHASPLSQLIVDRDALAEPIADLLSGDAARTRRVLRPPIDRRLLSFVIPLLGSDEVGRVARRVLRQAAPAALGQLVDALLDDAQPVEARRRLPDIIKTVKSPRAAAGLMAALECAETDVRERAAQALGELSRVDKSLRPDRGDVFRATERELMRGDVWLPRVFMFLELALEPEPLRLALRALRSDDRNLRGTSYEYLENVLPDSLRRELWPHLEAYRVRSDR